MQNSYLLHNQIQFNQTYYTVHPSIDSQQCSVELNQDEINNNIQMMMMMSKYILNYHSMSSYTR